MHVCACMCVPWYIMEVKEDLLWESLLPFHHLGCRVPAQVVRLVSNHLYLLSNLTANLFITHLQCWRLNPEVHTCEASTLTQYIQPLFLHFILNNSLPLLTLYISIRYAWCQVPYISHSFSFHQRWLCYSCCCCCYDQTLGQTEFYVCVIQTLHKLLYHIIIALRSSDDPQPADDKLKEVKKLTPRSYKQQGLRQGFEFQSQLVTMVSSSKARLVTMVQYSLRHSQASMLFLQDMTYQTATAGWLCWHSKINKDQLYLQPSGSLGRAR